MNWILLTIAGLFEVAFAFCLGKAKETTGHEMYWSVSWSLRSRPRFSGCFSWPPWSSLSLDWRRCHIDVTAKPESTLTMRLFAMGWINPGNRTANNILLRMNGQRYWISCDRFTIRVLIYISSWEVPGFASNRWLGIVFQLFSSWEFKQSLFFTNVHIGLIVPTEVIHSFLIQS